MSYAASELHNKLPEYLIDSLAAIATFKSEFELIYSCAGSAQTWLYSSRIASPDCGCTLKSGSWVN